jgi:purine-binding chemotaxis protein CheW
VRKVAEAVPQLQIVTFLIGTEEFGLDVFSVQEVLRYEPVTPIPKAPAFVEGIIEMRGTLVPVIDLRRRLEVDHATIDAQTRIVVIYFEGERLGLVVDAVTAVLRIPESAVSDPPRYFHGIAAEYIRGIAKLEERLVVLLQIERILTSEERIALQEAELTAAADPAQASDRE